MNKPPASHALGLITHDIVFHCGEKKEKKKNYNSHFGEPDLEETNKKHLRRISERSIVGRMKGTPKAAVRAYCIQQGPVHTIVHGSVSLLFKKN
tara:strand:- start:192 stop:473 length:282 start_codon:yes stop_codon:yes gene_type:complete